MQAMIVDAFQQVDDLIANLEDRVVNVVEDAFKVTNGLQERAIKSDMDGDGEEAPFDSEGQQPLGDGSFEDGDQEHGFDPIALEDATKELYVGSKCTKLVATIFLMNLCMIHGVSNNFVYELLELLHSHLLLELNCLVANYYAATTLTQKLGLDYENIHVCAKRCVLF